MERMVQPPGLMHGLQMQIGGYNSNPSVLEHPWEFPGV